MVDTVLARLIDVVLSVPFLLVAIALVSVTGPSLTVTIAGDRLLQLGVGGPHRARAGAVDHGSGSTSRRRGRWAPGDRRIMFVDVLPNVMAPVIVYTTLLIPVVIVAQATLSFLGLGLPPPTADWGGMISDGAELLHDRRGGSSSSPAWPC